MGVAMANFGDFVLSTDSSYIAGPRSLMVEATKRTFLLRRFLKNAPMSVVLQGGKSIKGNIVFDEQSTAEDYLPGQPAQWLNPQILENYEIQWRFTRDHMSYNDKEVELNAAGMSRSARFRHYVDLKWAKEQRVWLSLMKKMDGDLTAIPDAATMEAAGGAKTYSLFAYVNEQPNGLFDPGTAGQTAFTTVMGLDPTDAMTFGKWVPQQETYSEAPSATLGADWNGWTAFDRMFHLVKFSNVPDREEFGGKTSGQYFILCGLTGRTMVMNALRNGNDRLVYNVPNRQDASYMNPKFAGFDIVYHEDMDTATVYDDGAGGLTTEALADTAGPRFLWLNGDYLRPVFHSSRYFQKDDVLRHPQQPDTRVIPIDVWRNVFCTSRQRLGIISPSTDIVFP